jgi:hypothetical protein
MINVNSQLQTLDSGLNTAIKQKISRSLSVKMIASLRMSSQKFQKVEDFIPLIVDASQCACSKSAIVNCWRHVGIWPPTTTEDLIQKLQTSGVFRAEDEASLKLAKAVDRPGSLEDFNSYLDDEIAVNSAVNDTYSVEDRAKAATWEYALTVPELVMSPQKRKPAKGVGPGKFNGHYRPINVGPRAAALRANLRDEFKRVQNAKLKHQEQACGSHTMSFTPQKAKKARKEQEKQDKAYTRQLTNLLGVFIARLGFKTRSSFVKMNSKYLGGAASAADVALAVRDRYSQTGMSNLPWISQKKDRRGQPALLSVAWATKEEDKENNSDEEDSEDDGSEESSEQDEDE